MFIGIISGGGLEIVLSVEPANNYFIHFLVGLVNEYFFYLIYAYTTHFQTLLHGFRHVGYCEFIDFYVQNILIYCLLSVAEQSWDLPLKR